MRKKNPLPLTLSLTSILFVTLLVSLPTFALTLNEAFYLSLSGPESPIETHSLSLDYSYSLELASRYTTNQQLSSGELNASWRYKSLNLVSTLNFLNKTLNTRISLPLTVLKPKLPETVSTDSLVSLRGKITSLFFSLLETKNNLNAKIIACELSNASYAIAKSDFERGTVSFNALNQALELKQNDERQLQQLKASLKDLEDDLCYLLNLEEFQPLKHDYTVIFRNEDDLPLTAKEIEQLDYPILLAEYELAQAKTGLYPQVNLDATTTLNLEGNSTYYAGISFRYAIYDSSLKARVEAADSRLNLAKANREKNLRALFKQKKRLLSEYNNAVDAMISAEKKLLETSEFVKLAEIAFEEGLINTMDLKRAKLTYLQSENTYKAAQHKCVKMKLTLLGLIPYQQSPTNIIN
ncbi:MAG: TolC family protein [Firmicutes bacterium]|nr:TolC family protein [Bacillota bacterium]